MAIFEYMDDHRADDYFTSTRRNRIERYAIDILTGGQWATIYVGHEPMGDCKVVRLPHSYRASQLRLRVLQARDCPSINEILVLGE